VQAGQALTRPGAPGRPGVWGSSRVEGWWGEWLIYVRQSGGDLFTADGRRSLLDSPEAINGLRFYLEKSDKHGISAPVGFEPLNGFVNERVAMILGGTSTTGSITTRCPGSTGMCSCCPWAP
jgi:ABC-type glycerol-3-phosphate transport system substrate-binding protein